MRSEIVRALQTEYEEQRARNTAEEQRRRQAVRVRCPELDALLDRRQELIFAGMRGILNGTSAAEDLPGQMAALNERITAMLVENGFAPNWLDPVCRCPVCRDTGYVGEPVREMCECMRKRVHDRLFRAVGLEEAVPQTFERFDDSLFSDKVLPQYGVSQRQVMQMFRQKCEGWANAYPEVKAGTVVLSGASGLGKTYMLHAMAHRLLERGQNVLVISAYRYIELARKAYFTNDTADLDSLMDADVLMVDDFGSEPLMENVTIVQWFNLINERQIRRKGTVVSTNLGPKQLREMYTERIASRLLDTQTGLFLQFVGDDVRRR